MKSIFILFLLTWNVVLYGQPTNFYEYVKSFYEQEDLDNEEDDGPEERVDRLYKIWGERLYPHGDILKMIEGYNDYTDQFWSEGGIPSVPAHWRELGPVGNNSGGYDNMITCPGRVNRLTFDPKYGVSNFRIYACSAHGGLWRSDDSGDNWYVLNTDTQIPSTSVSDVAISFQNSNRIALSTGEPDQNLPGTLTQNTMGINPIHTTGVCRSFDGGQTWGPANNGLLANFALGGTIKRIAINPSNDNQVWIGTSNGLFVNYDFFGINSEWHEILDGTEAEVRGIEFKPGEDYVYVSSDRYILKIHCDNEVTTGDIEFLAFEDNSNLSPLVLGDIPNVTVTSINIAVCPERPDRLYAYLVGVFQVFDTPIGTDCDQNEPGDQGLQILNNIGVGQIYTFENNTWTKIYEYNDYGTCGPNTGGRISQSWNAITVHPNNPDMVVFGNTRVRGFFEQDLLTDKLDVPSSVLSADFITYRVYGDYTAGGTKVSHADCHALVFEPYIQGTLEDPMLFEGNDGGVFAKDVSFMNHDGWTSKLNGLAISTVWSFDDSDKDPKVIIAGMQDNGTSYLNPTTLSQDWEQFLEGDGYGCQIDDYFDRLFEMQNGITRSYFLDRDFIATEVTGNGCEVDELDDNSAPRDGDGQCKAEAVQTFHIEHHPRTYEPFYGLTEVYRRKQADGTINNANPTDLWEQRSDMSQNPEVQWKRWRLITELEFSESDPQRLYVATRGLDLNGNSPGGLIMEDIKCHLFKTNNFDGSAGGFWQNSNYVDLTPNLISEITDGIESYEFETDNGIVYMPPLITGIAVHPTNPDIVWLSFTGYEPGVKVWRTDDGGINWVNDDLNGSLLNLPANGIVIHEGTPNKLFLATDAGVWMKDEGSADWYRYGDVPNVRVTELKINRCANVLRVATFGRGIWETDLPISPYSSEIIIDEDTEWNEEKFFLTNLRVTNGAKLTINADVNMPAMGFIRVDIGSEIEVNNSTLTNKCGALWGGVEVWGAGNQVSQVPNSNQGKLTLNNATIENAHKGVWVRRNDSDCEIVEGSGGGIIKAENSIIRNCLAGVDFSPYIYHNTQNDPQNNQSSFHLCEFEVDDSFTEDFNFSSHVVLNNVYNPRFYGCEFKNSSSNLDGDPTTRGVGIRSTSSVFSVKGKCLEVCQQGCCGDIVPSKFTGLAYGVFADGAEGVDACVIKNCEFGDNRIGVRADGLVFGPSVTDCLFQVAYPYNSYPEHVQWGMYLDGTESFEVEGNSFIGSEDSGDEGDLIGLSVGNSYINDNRIYRNNFDNLAWSTHGQQENGGIDDDGIERGLSFVCDIYGASVDNGHDISVGSGQIKAYQSSYQAGFPVGNHHSHFCFPVDEDTEIRIDENALGFDYYHFDDGNGPQTPFDQCTSLEANTILVNAANQCLPSYEEAQLPEVMLDNYEVFGEIVDATHDIYRNAINGGNTAGLIDFIKNQSNSSIEVRNEMLICAPKISDEAFRQAFIRTPQMDQWHLAQVLLANSPLSPRVRQMMTTYGLEPYYRELVANGQNGSITVRAILETDMAYYAALKEYSKDGYIRHNTVWKESPSLTESMALLSSSNSPRDKYLLARIYLERGEYGNARNVLESCDANGPLGNECRVFEILIDSKESGQICPRFTASQELELASIANDESRPGYHHARALLGIESEPYFVQPMGTRRSVTSALDNEYEEFIQVQPNPSNSFVRFTINLPMDYETLRVRISNSTGQCLVDQDLKMLHGLWEWDVRNVNAGVYEYELYVDGVILGADKIVIVE